MNTDVELGDVSAHSRREFRELERPSATLEPFEPLSPKFSTPPRCFDVISIVTNLIHLLSTGGIATITFFYIWLFPPSLYVLSPCPKGVCHYAHFCASPAPLPCSVVVHSSEPFLASCTQKLKPAQMIRTSSW